MSIENFFSLFLNLKVAKEKREKKMVIFDCLCVLGCVGKKEEEIAKKNKREREMGP